MWLLVWRAKEVRRVSPAFNRVVGAAVWIAAGCVAGGEAPASAVELDATLVATLGDEEAGGGVGPFFTLAAGPRGEWFLSYLSARDRIMAFAQTGEYLRAVGRRGQGPGEFRFIQHVDASDSLVHVLDVGLRRWSRLSADLVWIDSTPLGVDGQAFVVVGDTAAVVNVRSFRYGMTASPVRVYAWGNGSVRGLGDSIDLTDPLENAAAGRALAPGRDGASVWVGHETRYRIEHWGINGDLLGVVEREVEWFPVGSGSYLPTPEEAPPPQMVGVYEDPSGLLWVAIQVADLEWIAGVVKSDFPEGTGYQVGDRNRFLDTVIEVLDGSTGEVIASKRFDAALTLVGGGATAEYHEDAHGVPRIEIRRLALRR